MTVSYLSHHAPPKASHAVRDVGVSLFLTPRDVERWAPRLSRRELTRRRALQHPPKHTMMSGCIVYAEDEIEQFLLDEEAIAKSNRVGECRK